MIIKKGCQLKAYASPASARPIARSKSASTIANLRATYVPQKIMTKSKISRTEKNVKQKKKKLYI